MIKRWIVMVVIFTFIFGTASTVFAVEEFDIGTITDEMLVNLTEEEYLKLIQNVNDVYGVEGLVVFNGTVVEKIGSMLTADMLKDILCDAQYHDGYKKYLLDVRSMYERKNNNNQHSNVFEVMMRDVLVNGDISDDLKQYIYQTIRSYTQEDIELLKNELLTASDSYLEGTVLLKLTNLDQDFVLHYIDQNLDLVNSLDEVKNVCMLNSLEYFLEENNPAAEAIFIREVTNFLKNTGYYSNGNPAIDYSDAIIITANASENEDVWATVAEYIDAFTDEILVGNILSDKAATIWDMMNDENAAIMKAGNILQDKSERANEAINKAFSFSYTGLAAFRDGVMDVEWHAGVCSGQNAIIHITKGGHPDEVTIKKFTEPSNKFKGFYRSPNYAVGNSKYTAIYRTADTIKGRPAISYSALFPIDTNKSSGKISPEDITKLRCDGLLEYSFEYNGVRLLSVYYNNTMYWDISTVEGAIAHNLSVGAVSPKAQANSLTYYAGAE